MGNKKKLINKGLIDKFPDNIGVFVDVFAGSSIVGMNVSAEKHIVNDLDSNLFVMYELFRGINAEKQQQRIMKVMVGVKMMKPTYIQNLKDYLRIILNGHYQMLSIIKVKSISC